MKKNIFKLSFIIAFLLSGSQVFSQTIPQPIGVTCPSNNSSYVFIAEFDDFDGWTGDLTNNNNGGNWEVPGNSDSSDTGPYSAYSGSNYMNFEASGGSNLFASTVSPVIDLTTATDGAELSFYMFAYGVGIGTLEVGISNSSSGPFTNLFTWTGQLQTSLAEPWMPVGINLDAYLGQSIYLEFKQTRTNNHLGDMAIDLVRVETCGTFCLSPTVSIDDIDSDVSGASVDVSWIPNDSETSWEYAVLPAGSSSPTTGILTSDTNFTEDGLSYNTEYDIYVRANCTNGNSIWVGPLTFTTPIQTDFIIDCTAGPLMGSMCYRDGGADNPEVFTYTSTDGTPLTLTFLSGFVQDGWDPLVVIDTDGSSIVAFDDFFYGNEGDLTGVSYTSTGDRISFYIASDDFVPSSCANGDAPMNAGISYTVACNTCANSESTFTFVDDCTNGDQFLIDVNVTSLGSATSLTLSNNIDSNTTSITTVGAYQIGPFPFLTDVIYTLNNDQDINCVFNSLPIELSGCMPDNDECQNATIAIVNTTQDCVQLTSGTILAATPSNEVEVSCNSVGADDDVWFQFTALNDTQIITFENIVENGASMGLNYAVYEGSCGALNEMYCVEGISSITPQLVIGNTYYIRVFSAGSEGEDITFDLCIRPGFNSIEVSDSSHTIEELVQDILFGSDCANVSNITFTTGTTFNATQPNGIGYFSMDGEGFPFSEGVLMSTGRAINAAGTNDDLISSGGFAWPGDDDLNTNLGVDSRNATIIEFDFVPYSQTISFDFLMASEEYNGSEFECNFSDAFAFFLTDSNNITTNLAVLPNTETPILVTNVHPQNSSCLAINEEYFGRYTGGNLPPMDYNGRTTVFTAQSSVNRGESYHIKLVVADDTDTQFDTGIFLKAGSFDIGEFSLGEDITIDAGTATCLNEPVVLNTFAPNFPHIWFKDGFVIPDETSSTLVVTEPDYYEVQVVFSDNCTIFDAILIEFLSPPEATQPQNLFGCSDDNIELFELTDQNSEILGIQDPDNYTITYHQTETDANEGISDLGSTYQNISNPQTIYVRLEDNNTGCFDTASFDLMFGFSPVTSFSLDFDYEVCPNNTTPILIEAIPENYNMSEVSVFWYRDGSIIDNENTLSLLVIEAGLYEVEVVFNDTGCNGFTEITVVELETCVVPQGISPGVSPGFNDYFDLSSFNVTKLEIFNRNGTLVYSKKNYTNEWEGQTNDGKELPVGTYFYIMEYEGGTKRRSSWVYINK